jgi:phosphoribosylglycinamide formyltransferase-1
MKNIVILISGGLEHGGDRQGLGAEGWPAQVAAVISNRADAAGLASRRRTASPPRSSTTRLRSREAFDAQLAEAIDAFSPDVVALAGFMRILTPGFVQRYDGRLVNIHPSLLPMFPGLHTHRRAIEAGCKVAGASVHFVTADLDHGPIIGQATVPVLADDSEQSLAARVLAQEHVLYPRRHPLARRGRARARARASCGTSAARRSSWSLLRTAVNFQTLVRVVAAGSGAVKRPSIVWPSARDGVLRRVVDVQPLPALRAEATWFTPGQTDVLVVASIELPVRVISFAIGGSPPTLAEAEVEVEVEVERAIVGGRRQRPAGRIELLAAPTSVVVHAPSHHRAAGDAARQGTEGEPARQRGHRHQQHVDGARAGVARDRRAAGDRVDADALPHEAADVRRARQHREQLREAERLLAAAVDLAVADDDQQLLEPLVLLVEAELLERLAVQSSDAFHSPRSSSSPAPSCARCRDGADRVEEEDRVHVGSVKRRCS